MNEERKKNNMIGLTALRRRGKELGFDVRIDKKQAPYTYYIKDKQLDINPVIKTDREGAAAFLLNGIDAYLHHCEMLDIEPF